MKDYEAKMIRTHLYSKNCLLREKACEFLAKTNSAGAGEGLLKAFSSSNCFVATRAGWGLSLMKKKISVPLLIKALNDPKTCYHAAWSLRKIESEEGEQALASALKNPDPLIRREAASSLRDRTISKTPAVQRALIEMLDSDKGQATITLGVTKTKEALDALAKALDNEKFVSRAMAIFHLAEAKDTRALEPALKMLKSKGYDRSTALWALEILGNPKALAPVTDYIGKFSDGRHVNMLNHALKTLDSLKKAVTVETLFPLLEKRDYKLRLAGTTALGVVASENAKESLIIMLSDEHWLVRGAAAEGLGRIRSIDALPALLESLKDLSWYVRWYSAEALGKLKNSQAVPALLKAFKDKNEIVRVSAAKALNEIGDRKAEEKMIKALFEEAPFIRRAAFEFLGKIKSKKAVPVLIERLFDDFWIERMRAAEALGGIGDRRALKSLKKLLKDESAEVYMAAEKAIRQINEPKLKTFKYLYGSRIG